MGGALTLPYNIFPLSLLEASPRGKIQQVGGHQAAYQEHLKEQAAESSQRAQVEQNMSLLRNKFSGIADQNSPI